MDTRDPILGVEWGGDQKTGKKDCLMTGKELNFGLNNQTENEWKKKVINIEEPPTYK